MASANGKEPSGSSASTGRPRTAASSTVEAAALAAGIEKTREDLAGTLDAIADRVSPKRVVRRTKDKVAASVKEGAAAAKESVIDGAAAAKVAVQDFTGKPSLPAPPAVGSRPESETAARSMAELPPVGGVVLPDLAPIPPSTSPVLGALPDRTPAVPAYGSGGSQVKKEYLVGAALLLGLLVLLLRRRSR